MLYVIMFAVYVARRAFVVVTLLYEVLNVLLAQETIKALEFEFGTEDMARFTSSLFT